MTDCIQAGMLGVQVLTFGGLIWYAIETMKIRRAAQQQVQSSLDLIKAATDQVEGMSKPCLTFWGELRDGADAILEMNGAVGNIVAAADQGSYVVYNIGNGVALNVRYHFTRPMMHLNEHLNADRYRIYWRQAEQPWLRPLGDTTSSMTWSLSTRASAADPIAHEFT